MKWLLLAVVALTGCGTLDAGECRNAYDLGFRDAILGRQRQDDLYAAQCSRSGTQLDTAVYAQGWREGKYEFDQRASQDGIN